MNKTQEALKMAIKALNKEPNCMEDFEFKEEAISACKEALAECEQSEDVARVQYDMSVEWNPNLQEDLPAGTKLYTTPSGQSAELHSQLVEIERLKTEIVKLNGGYYEPEPTKNKIERLKAREARLLEGIKAMQNLSTEKLRRFYAQNLIKEIEAEK